MAEKHHNIFKALGLPYEAAALEILELVDRTPDRSAIEMAAAVIRQTVEDEHKRLRAILGFDVEEEREEGGHKYRVCHDPYWNLEGAVIDLGRQDADEVCIGTIKKHQAKLIAFDKATKPKEG